jgi:hypothetical protein
MADVVRCADGVWRQLEDSLIDPGLSDVADFLEEFGDYGEGFSKEFDPSGISRRSRGVNPQVKRYSTWSEI